MGRPAGPSRFFFAELKDRARALLRDVHSLARAYHWTQTDVFLLTHRRRTAYLGILEEENDALLVAGVRGGTADE